jgi:hypothetical protein
MVNQHEIDFAAQTVDRAIELSSSMTAYLKKLVYVVASYADAAKIPGKDQGTDNFAKCKFSIGKWHVWVYGYSWRNNWKDDPVMQLSYDRTVLAKIMFYETINEEVVSETSEEKVISKKKDLGIEVLKLNVDNNNLQSLTAFIEEIDKRLTDMQITASRVL